MQRLCVTQLDSCFLGVVCQLQGLWKGVHCEGNGPRGAVPLLVIRPEGLE